MPFDFKQPSYQALRKVVSERTTPLAIWVGSGPSREAGLPDWNGLVRILTEQGMQKAASLSEGDGTALKQRLQTASQTKDLWLAVQRIAEAIGQTSYEATIRQALFTGSDAPIPKLYELLWRLPVRRVLTTNLDPFVSRAFASNFRGTRLTQFNGLQSSTHLHLLQSPDPFVVHLHGELDDSGSWILTRKDLSTLLKHRGYQTLVSTILTSTVVVFIGLSADDVATGGHLERLTKSGVTLGQHFWITTRTDAQTDTWAENAGIRVVRYGTDNGSHTQLEEAVIDLLSFESVDAKAQPVVATTARTEDRIPSPETLRTQTPEQVRVALNNHALSMLSKTNAAESFAKFLEDYEEAVHRAWFISTRPPNNVVLGYTIQSAEKEGAFGRVYRATDKQGRSVALKVLGEGVRSNVAYLECFRRGVESMRILTKRGIEGMVPYSEASEIPACAIMNFIEGPNLEEAVDSRHLKGWEQTIPVALKVATIIHSAHSLPERVLHRDIRPANIMLDNFFVDPDALKVVVLDFDLSWHKGAMGMSMDNPNASSGFVAPEQTRAERGQSTRNALVDSFGLGMTLFFLASGTKPVHSQHKHADWREILTEQVGKQECRTWKSLPRRFARLIEWATKHSQADRWDMTQIKGELSRLQDALANPADITSAELLAEEISANSRMRDNYKWDRSSYAATTSLPSGVAISVSGDENKGRVDLRMSYTDTGLSKRREIGKWLPQACQQAVAILKKSGWMQASASRGRDTAVVTATFRCSETGRDCSRLATGLDESMTALSFE